MRTDLQPGFIDAKNSSFRKPRQLLVFHFPEAGPVYVSDQRLSAADGLGAEYLPLVESWGELREAADAMAADSGEISQMSVTLWNGGALPFSNRFLGEYPENVEVELYQWFAGRPESDKALIDRFIVADPIEFDEASRLLRLDLVSIGIRYEQPCGELLTRDAWPYAADGDIGRGIPQAFGSTGPIPALKAKTSQVLRLKGSVLSNTMTLQVYEDLDALAFPAAGTVQIDEEKIRYSGRTASSLSVIQRGYLSTAAEHLDKRDVISVINDHTFVLCVGPVTAIANVRIDGYPAPVGIYTSRPDLNPARIIFTEKPWVKKFAEATRFLEMQFDAIGPGNTALQPAYAFDAADLATAAAIKSGNSTLALRQTTVNRNRGEILKAYLAIEHWESGLFLSDYAEVSVSGVGVVGRLSRPNPADQVAIDADVDVDHGHSHEIGGEHIHNFTQPAVETSDPLHDHSATVQGAVITDGSSTGLPLTVNVFTGTVSRTFSFTSQSNILSRRLHVRFQKTGVGRVTLQIPGADPYWDGDVTVDQWFNLSGFTSSVVFTIQGAGAVGGYVTFYEVTYETTLVGAITANKTNLTAAASGGTVRNTGVVGVKNPDDVLPFTENNRHVNVRAQDNPSRTIVNLFDLTSDVNFNWDWFTNRDITVRYVSAGEAKVVYILHVFFDVEYVPVEIVHSDAVTAEVTTLDDRVRPDLAVRHLLTTRAGVPASLIDGASFTAIGNRFAAMGYRIDGLIEAEATVREAIRRICYQSRARFFGNGGTLKMVLREGHPASKPRVRSLDGNHIQLRSIAVARQPLSEISNRVQLFYKRDWTATDGASAGYLDSVTREDALSVARFGLKARRDGYNFDLIRSASMAADVADFYLQTDAWPSSFYTFNAYLAQFDLEKEDVVEVSAGFNRMNKVPMVVRAVERIFASGKSGQINLLQVVAENLYYILKELSLAEAVLVLDALSFAVTSMSEQAEVVQMIDELLLQLHLRREEAVAVADLLLSIWEMRVVLTAAVTVLDGLAADQQMRWQDAVVMEDFPEFYSVYGFGSGGFGQVPFGGMSSWRQKSPDEVVIYEVILMALMALRQDTVTAADRLMLVDGFGGVRGGFGLTPFGL